MHLGPRRVEVVTLRDETYFEMAKNYGRKDPSSKEFDSRVFEKNLLSSFCEIWFCKITDKNVPEHLKEYGKHTIMTAEEAIIVEQILREHQQYASAPAPVFASFEVLPQVLQSADSNANETLREQLLKLRKNVESMIVMMKQAADNKHLQLFQLGLRGPLRCSRFIIENKDDFENMIKTILNSEPRHFFKMLDTLGYRPVHPKREYTHFQYMRGQDRLDQTIKKLTDRVAASP